MNATGMADRKDLAGKAVERSNLYGFLATIFREEPSATQLRTIRSGEFLDALSEAGVALGDDVLGFADDELLDRLAVEYTRLFIGPGTHVPPYEGAQREGVLWGHSTSDVAAFVAGSGFQYKPGYHDLPDHISVELEFMQEVTRREASAWAKQDYVEARRCLAIEWEFIDEHLARWAPAFCRTVATTTTSFYREMANLTRRFIEQENVAIAAQLDTDDRLSQVEPTLSANPS